MTLIISGLVEPGFAAVREAFTRNFAEGHEVGASLCVCHRGVPVVDVWAGTADQATGRAWERDTLAPLTSVTKAVLVTLALMLVQRGDVELDAPLADYWPEFAAHGKRRITLRCVLAHRAGIPAFQRAVTLDEQVARTPVIEALTTLKPVWPPGTEHGYHAITNGFLLSEVIRRTAGISEGGLLRKSITEPLNLDLHIGLPTEDIARVAKVIVPPQHTPADDIAPELREYATAIHDARSLTYRATFGSTAMSFDDMNDARYYTAARPSGGAYGTATSVAALLAAVIGEAGDGRLLTPQWVDRARTVQSEGKDRVFLMTTRWGLGYQLPGGPLWPEFGVNAFGHIGSTGAIAFADADNDLTFAYLPNRMKSVVECTDRRVQALIGATYRSLS